MRTQALLTPPIDGMVYIYGLIDPINNELFYVGRGKDARVRLNAHVSDARFDNGNKTRNRRIKAILDRGERPSLIVLDIVPIAEGDIAEKKWIHNSVQGSNVLIPRALDDGQSDDVTVLIRVNRNKWESIQPKIREMINS